MKKFGFMSSVGEAVWEYLYPFQSRGVEPEVVSTLLARFEAEDGDIPVGMMKEDRGSADMRSDIDYLSRDKVLKRKKRIVVSLQYL